jgi:TRAP-type C4-dicarboxylate transport system permease small subunit
MKFRALLENFERNVANISLAALVAVLVLQVFFRYVLQIGISWSEEVSRFLFIWFVYISASYAVQVGTHIRVSLVVDFMPTVMQRPMQIISDLLWIGFNAIVIVSGIQLIATMIEHPVYSTSLLLPLSAVYVIIPLSHTLMILRILLSYRDGTGTWRRPDGHQ